MSDEKGNNPTDLELISEANLGNGEAMEALYYRYRNWVFALAMRLTGNAQDAGDVLQEVFAYLFGKFPGFILTSKLKTFLYPAVRNTSLNLIRTRRRNKMISTSFADSLVSKDAGLHDQRLKILEWVETNNINADQRELIMLRFHDGNTLQEIADLLCVPLGTVKSRLSRTQLREMLEQ